MAEEHAGERLDLDVRERCALREREASTAPIQSTGRWPAPTATRQPMILRTMWCRNAEPSKSKRQ